MYKTKHVIRDPIHGNEAAVATYPLDIAHEGNLTKEGARKHLHFLIKH
jgi:hypothetical protein